MSELPTPSASPYSRSRALPPYRGIVAVDAKDFTGHPAVEHGTISRNIPQLLKMSLERAGLGELWSGRRFPNSTGDGYVFGFDPAAMPFVIHPWLHQLQDILTEFNVHSHGVAGLRLRVSLHIGPLPDSGEEFDGNGTPRNDTHRLLDSRPVKAMLAASSENITQVAVIVSDRCFQDAVASGYTGRHPDHFIEVPATVEGKRFAQRAWLYIPAPSGNLYDRRILGDQVMDDQRKAVPEERPGERRGGKVVNRADHGNINSGTVHGGQHVSNVGGDQHVSNVGGDQHVSNVGGDQVGGHKVGTVRGNLGDTVQGDKNSGSR